jgi:hypothetical protein
MKSIHLTNWIHEVFVERPEMIGIDEKRYLIGQCRTTTKRLSTLRPIPEMMPEEIGVDNIYKI